jgi:hypothetical protein
LKLRKSRRDKNSIAASSLEATTTADVFRDTLSLAASRIKTREGNRRVGFDVQESRRRATLLRRTLYQLSQTPPITRAGTHSSPRSMPLTARPPSWRPGVTAIWAAG